MRIRFSILLSLVVLSSIVQGQKKLQLFLTTSTIIEDLDKENSVYNTIRVRPGLGVSFKSKSNKIHRFSVREFWFEKDTVNEVILGSNTDVGILNVDGSIRYELIFRETNQKLNWNIGALFSYSKQAVKPNRERYFKRILTHKDFYPEVGITYRLQSVKNRIEFSIPIKILRIRWSRLNAQNPAIPARQQVQDSTIKVQLFPKVLEFRAAIFL